MTPINTDNVAIQALHEAGKSTRAIETILGYDHATVARRLKHLTPRKTTEIYKTLRADIFAEKQRQLLMSSDKATPKEMRDIATSVGILFDKERLERNQSTENIGVNVSIEDKLRQALKASIPSQDTHTKGD